MQLDVRQQPDTRYHTDPARRAYVAAASKRWYAENKTLVQARQSTLAYRLHRSERRRAKTKG